MENPKVLLVDDETDLVDSLSQDLQRVGYLVVTAQDGNSALDLARGEIPHLILLDLMLPGLDGYRLLKLLKSDERYRKIPVLVITARADASDLAQAVACGADGCLVKPLKRELLLERVHALIGKGNHNGRST